VLAFDFSVWICYLFLLSKCRKESDLGLCMTLVLAKIKKERKKERMPLRSADFQYENVFGRKIHRKSALRSGLLFASTEVMHTHRSDFPLHFDSRNI